MNESDRQRSDEHHGATDQQPRSARALHDVGVSHEPIMLETDVALVRADPTTMPDQLRTSRNS
jgi:hypothetical protein